MTTSDDPHLDLGPIELAGDDDGGQLEPGPEPEQEPGIPRVPRPRLPADDDPGAVQVDDGLDPSGPDPGSLADMGAGIDLSQIREEYGSGAYVEKLARPPQMRRTRIVPRAVMPSGHIECPYCLALTLDYPALCEHIQRAHKASDLLVRVAELTAENDQIGARLEALAAQAGHLQRRRWWIPGSRKRIPNSHIDLGIEEVWPGNEAS